MAGHGVFFRLRDQERSTPQMTCQDDCTTCNCSTCPTSSKPLLTLASSLSSLPETLLESVLEQLVAGGFAALPDAMRLLMNAAMRVERQQYLGAREHERT